MSNVQSFAGGFSSLEFSKEVIKMAQEICAVCDGHGFVVDDNYNEHKCSSCNGEGWVVD